ncbi:Hypothetical predicted protein, partial [Paramuricea clavata]
RGREGQRNFTVNSFAFEVDNSGRPYVRLTHDESSENHPGGLTDVSSTEKEARIYETNQPVVGYKALALYLEKVNPNCPALFQYYAWEIETTTTSSMADRRLFVSSDAELSDVEENTTKNVEFKRTNKINVVKYLNITEKGKLR